MVNIWKLTLPHVQITLEHVPEKDWIYIKYCGHLNAADVIAAAERELELQKELRVPKILNDKSEVTGDWEEANDWLEYEWLPIATANGLRYFSMVLSRDLHDLGPAQDLEKRFPPICQAKLFRNPNQAAAWLESKP